MTAYVATNDDTNEAITIYGCNHLEEVIDYVDRNKPNWMQVAIIKKENE